MSLETYLRAAPKAELHLHLEGAIRPTTILTLAQRNAVDLPYATLEELGEWFRFRDFAHFIEVYGGISRCLRTAEDYELIAYELAEELARQNARYAEVVFSPAFHSRMGVSAATYLDGLGRARERARREVDVELAWIFDLGRAWQGGETETQRWAAYTVDVAIEARSEGVVALGLGGPEAGHPPCTAHRMPESMSGRPAYGARSTRWPRSALPTGFARSKTRRWSPSWRREASRWTSARPATFAWACTRVDEILLNAVRHSFLPEPAKQRREADYRAQLDALKVVHLLA